MTFGTILISLAIGLSGLLLFLIGFVILKTALYSPTPKSGKSRKFVEIDGQSVAERLSLAVQYKTISYQNPEKVDGDSFLGLHRLLRTLYPQVHTKLNLEKVNDYSLLYTWEGKDPDLKPIMLISHLDVVPAEGDEQGRWTHPPFSGEITDGYVWGRGTIDVKNGVIGILEAVEYLLKHDFQPERTVYLGFGHDEEVGGNQGAAAIAATLDSRGVELACLLDEGGSVIDSFMPTLDVPVGVIGISEKGYLSLRLTVSVDGGHSSMPPQETAIGILSRAITNLENNPMPAHLEVVEFIMSYLGSRLSFFQRMLYANTWLFGGLLKKKLSKIELLNASIRTTTAPTMIDAGVKDNILPGTAEAVVNFRILPGDDLRSVYEMVLERIDDPRVDVSPLEGDTLKGANSWNPSPVADIDSPCFVRLFSLVRGAYPDALVTPYLVLGGTDARHYAPVTVNAFRFLPMQASRDDLQRMHGDDERISIENCGKMVAFYIAYIEEISTTSEEVEEEIETKIDTSEAIEDFEALETKDKIDEIEEIDEIEAFDEGLALTAEEMAAFEAARAQQKLNDVSIDDEMEEAENPEDEDLDQA